MVLDDCDECMEYWVTNGSNMEGYRYLASNRHIPMAHHPAQNNISMQAQQPIPKYSDIPQYLHPDVLVPPPPPRRLPSPASSGSPAAAARPLRRFRRSLGSESAPSSASSTAASPSAAASAPLLPPADTSIPEDPAMPDQSHNITIPEDPAMPTPTPQQLQQQMKMAQFKMPVKGGGGGNQKAVKFEDVDEFSCGVDDDDEFDDEDDEDMSEDEMEEAHRHAMSKMKPGGAIGNGPDQTSMLPAKKNNRMTLQNDNTAAIPAFGGWGETTGFLGADEVPICLWGFWHIHVSSNVAGALAYVSGSSKISLDDKRIMGLKIKSRMV